MSMVPGETRAPTIRSSATSGSRSERRIVLILLPRANNRLVIRVPTRRDPCCVRDTDPLQEGGHVRNYVHPLAAARSDRGGRCARLPSGDGCSEAGRGGLRRRRDPRLRLCARTRLRLLLSIWVLRLSGILLYACCRCRRWLGMGWLGVRPSQAKGCHSSDDLEHRTCLGHRKVFSRNDRSAAREVSILPFSLK